MTKYTAATRAELAKVEAVLVGQTITLYRNAKGVAVVANGKTIRWGSNVADAVARSLAALAKTNA
jgi:hypothetical protein